MQLKRREEVAMLSQPEFRRVLKYLGLYTDEDALKYNYDRYTWFKKVKPIRKMKIRKKVANAARYQKINLQLVLEKEHILTAV
jgi:hypothetical protein